MKLYLVVLVCLFASTFSAPIAENVVEASIGSVSAKVEIEVSSEQPKTTSPAAPTQASTAEEPKIEKVNAIKADIPTSEESKEKEPSAEDAKINTSNESTGTAEETKVDEVKADAPKSSDEPKSEETKTEESKPEETEAEITKQEDSNTKVASEGNSEAKSDKVNQETQVQEIKVDAPHPTAETKFEPAVAAEGRSRGRGSVKYHDTKLLHHENDVSFDGSYKYSFADDAGSTVNQEGVMKKIDDDLSANSVKGGYSYTDDDGNDFSVTYVADENGYQPVGAHLPVAPEIPPAIARALAYLATAKPWVDPSVHPTKSAKKAKQLDIEESRDVVIAVKSGEEEAKLIAENKSTETSESEPAGTTADPEAVTVTDAPSSGGASSSTETTTIADESDATPQPDATEGSGEQSTTAAAEADEKPAEATTASQ